MLPGEIEAETSSMAFQNYISDKYWSWDSNAGLFDSKDSTSLLFLCICPIKSHMAFIKDYGWRIWLNFAEQQSWNKVN